jgi:hypothetical protein
MPHEEGETGVNDGGKKNNTKYLLNGYHVMLGCLIEAVQKKSESLLDLPI